MLAARPWCLALLGALVPALSFAYPGELDPTFGVGGIMSGPSGYARDLLIQPDGKIVTVGNGSTGGVVVRRTMSGTLDGGFGTGGAAPPSIVIAPEVVALQSNGKLVVAGSGALFGGSWAIARHHPDGTVDDSFGQGGGVSTDLEADTFGITALTVQSDDRIVVAGYAASPAGAFLAVVRYEPDGTPDASFGVSGVARAGFDTRGITPTAIAILSDGTLVVAGGIPLPPTGYSTALVRYDASGGLDLTFGVAGLALVQFGPLRSNAIGLSVESDGKIVVAAAPVHDDSNFLLARLRADGSLDPMFGLGGTVVGPAGAEAAALLRQADGKLIVTGSSGKFTLARYLADGMLDGTFGIDGVTHGPDGASQAAALDADGRVVVLGVDGFTSALQFKLARYTTTGEAVRRCDIDAPNPTLQCDDGNPCTIEQCRFLDRVCISQPLFLMPCEVDGNECTTGTCDPGGSCVETATGPGPCTDDGDPCTTDRCEQDSPYHVTCTHRAEIDFSCPLPGAAMLSMVNAPGQSRVDRFRFRWSLGEAAKADFGTPVATTSFRFCAWRFDPGPTPITLLAARIDPAATCTTSACWVERERGWKYRSTTGEPDGVTRLLLSEGRQAGHARIDVKGTGPELMLPELPFPGYGQVHAELRSSDGRCWAAFLTDAKRTDRIYVGRSQRIGSVSAP